MTDPPASARPRADNGSARRQRPPRPSGARLGGLAPARQRGRARVRSLGTEATKAGAKLAGRLAERAGRSVARRLTADLDDRDPDYIRENLSLSWLFASIWYRAEIRNLANVPEQGPVLLVGNHTGGNMSPETITSRSRSQTFFGVERRFHQLAHNLVLASPLGPFLRQLRHRRGLPRQREEGPRGGRGRPRLPRRRLGGLATELAELADRLRRAQGVHPPGARARRADRPGGHHRRPGDGSLAQPGRLARARCSSSTSASG